MAVQNNKRRRRKRVSNASHSSFVDENGVYHEAPVKKIKKTRVRAPPPPQCLVVRGGCWGLWLRGCCARLLRAFAETTRADSL